MRATLAYTILYAEDVSATLEFYEAAFGLERRFVTPGVTITMVTDDVPATMEAAVAAGARRYVDPVDKPWGQTVGYVIDPNGVLIEIATAIAG